MAFQRFVDRKDKANILKDSPDFYFRRHGLPPSWILYSFVAAMLIVVIMINYMSIRLITLPENEPTPITEVLGFLFTISTLILGISFASYIIIRRITDIVLHTEFQNLLFSSSMSWNTAFCLIAHPTHGVIYFDYNFDQFFTSSSKNPDQMDRLFSSGGLKDEDKARITAAIQGSTAAEVPFAALEGKSPMTLKLEPLARPRGFVVIRAYKA